MTKSTRGGQPSKGTKKDGRLSSNKGRTGAAPMPGPPKSTGTPVGAPAPKVKSPKKIK